MQQGKLYKCKIKLRTTFNGNELKPEVIPLNGVVLELECLWLIDPGELYDGEYALGPAYGSDPSKDDLMNIGSISWIASGDVEVIDEV